MRYPPNDSKRRPNKSAVSISSPKSISSITKLPKKKSVRRAFLPFFFAAAVLFSCAPKNPRIDSLDPKIGVAGEILTIKGENFGEEKNESFVTIAGISPTTSSYTHWQDDRISLRSPDAGESGLVYVYVKNKKSNGVLFANRAGLPRPVPGADTGMGPRVISVNPPSGSTGSIITVTGNNFGASREGSGVFFAWEGEASPSAPMEARADELVEVSETEFGYEAWSEREIRVRVPDGAVSGNMQVRTQRGNSRSFYFETSGSPGTKLFNDKRSYTIHYSVNVKVNETDGNNTLYLWMPQPAVSAAQRNRELLSRNREPFVENYNGASLFKIDNLSRNSDTHIDLSYKVDVYAVETAMRPQAVRQEDNSALAIYTQADALVPANDPRVIEQAAALARQEKNPYIKAQRIYEWLINENIISEARNTNAANNGRQSAESNVPADALEAKRADPYTAALLYCALARASGIPCIPVAGVLVGRTLQTQKHYWVEFWIDGAGWIPADPAMGAGAVPPQFRTRQDRSSFYFGNIDSQRIAFSRGTAGFSQMDPRGRPLGRVRSYALQNLWEEAAGGLESYSSLWSDITVTGIY